MSEAAVPATPGASSHESSAVQPPLLEGRIDLSNDNHYNHCMRMLFPPFRYDANDDPVSSVTPVASLPSTCVCHHCGKELARPAKLRHFHHGRSQTTPHLNRCIPFGTTFASLEEKCHATAARLAAERNARVAKRASGQSVVSSLARQSTGGSSVPSRPLGQPTMDNFVRATPRPAQTIADEAAVICLAENNLSVNRVASLQRFAEAVLHAGRGPSGPGTMRSTRKRMAEDQNGATSAMLHSVSPGLKAVTVFFDKTSQGARHRLMVEVRVVDREWIPVSRLAMAWDCTDNGALVSMTGINEVTRIISGLFKLDKDILGKLAASITDQGGGDPTASRLLIRAAGMRGPDHDIANHFAFSEACNAHYLDLIIESFCRLFPVLFHHETGLLIKFGQFARHFKINELAFAKAKELNKTILDAPRYSSVRFNSFIGLLSSLITWALSGVLAALVAPTQTIQAEEAQRINNLTNENLETIVRVYKVFRGLNISLKELQSDALESVALLPKVVASVMAELKVAEDDPEPIAEAKRATMARLEKTSEKKEARFPGVWPVMHKTLKALQKLRGNKATETAKAEAAANVVRDLDPVSGNSAGARRAKQVGVALIALHLSAHPTRVLAEGLPDAVFVLYAKAMIPVAPTPPPQVVSAAHDGQPQGKPTRKRPLAAVDDEDLDLSVLNGPRPVKMPEPLTFAAPVVQMTEQMVEVSINSDLKTFRERIHRFAADTATFWRTYEEELKTLAMLARCVFACKPSTAGIERMIKPTNEIAGRGGKRMLHDTMVEEATVRLGATLERRSERAKTAPRPAATSTKESPIIKNYLVQFQISKLQRQLAALPEGAAARKEIEADIVSVGGEVTEVLEVGLAGTGAPGAEETSDGESADEDFEEEDMAPLMTEADLDAEFEDLPPLPEN